MCENEKIKLPYSVNVTDYHILSKQDDNIKINYKKKVYDCQVVEENNILKPYKANAKKLYMNKNVSKNARSAIFSFGLYVNSETNCIQLENGEFPKHEDLLNITLFGRTVLYKTLKELKELEVIQVFKEDNIYKIYFNPFLFRCQDYISKSTYELFMYSEYNNFKVKNRDYVVENDKSKKFKARAKIAYADDGTKCLSMFECKVHNYLLTLNIKDLKKEVFYRDIVDNPELIDMCGLKRCDWTFVFDGNLYIVEYFGLLNQGNYNKIHDLKFKIMKSDDKINLFIPIYQRDLNKLDNVFIDFKLNTPQN